MALLIQNSGKYLNWLVTEKKTIEICLSTKNISPSAKNKRFIIWLPREKSMQIKISFTLFIYAFTSHVNSKQQVAEVLLFNSQFHLFTIFAAEF